MPLSPDPVGPVSLVEGRFAFAWGPVNIDGDTARGVLGVHEATGSAVNRLTPTPTSLYADSGSDAAGLFRGPTKIATTGGTTIWLRGAEGVNTGVAGHNAQQLYAAPADALKHFDPDGGPDILFTDVTACGFAAIGTFLAIDVVGDVYGWGWNGSGELGVGDTTVRPPPALGTVVWGHVSFGAPAVRVHAGARHALVLDTQGRVWSSGFNNRGQLGRGTIGVNSTSWGQVTPPTGGRTFIDIAAAGDVTLLLVSDGTVIGCGRNTAGNLGPTAATPGGSTLGIELVGISDIVEVMSGGSQSWFRTSLGQLYAMGNFFSSPYGRLLDTNGTQVNSAPTGMVVRLDWATPGVLCKKLGYSSGNNDSVVGIAPAFAVIGTDDRLYIWTSNFGGERGDGTSVLINGSGAINPNQRIFESYLGLRAQAVTIQQVYHEVFVTADGTLSTYHLPLWTGGVSKAFRSSGGAGNDPSNWFGTLFDDTSWAAPVLITPDPVMPADDPLNRGEPVWPTATEAGGGRMLARWHFVPPATSAYNVVPGHMMGVFGYNQDTGPSLRRSVANRGGLLTTSTTSVIADTSNTRILDLVTPPNTHAPLPAGWYAYGFNDSAWPFAVVTTAVGGDTYPTGTQPLFNKAVIPAAEEFTESPVRFTFTLPAGTYSSAVVSIAHKYAAVFPGLFINGVAFTSSVAAVGATLRINVPVNAFLPDATNVIALNLLGDIDTFPGEAWVALRVDLVAYAALETFYASGVNTRVLRQHPSPPGAPLVGYGLGIAVDWFQPAYNDSSWSFAILADNSPLVGGNDPGLLTGQTPLWYTFQPQDGYEWNYFRTEFTLAFGDDALISAFLTMQTDTAAVSPIMFVNGVQLDPTLPDPPSWPRGTSFSFVVPTENLIADGVNRVAIAVQNLGGEITFGTDDRAWLAFQLDVVVYDATPPITDVYYVNGAIPATESVALNTVTTGIDNQWAYRTSDAAEALLDPTAWAQIDVLLAYVSALAEGITVSPFGAGGRSYAQIVG